MTSQEIKQHCEENPHLTPETSWLREIAYHTARIAEHLDRAEPGKRDADSERGEMCRWGWHKFHSGNPSAAEMCQRCGWTAQEIKQRQQPVVPATEATRQQKENHPADCACPTCRFHRPL